MVISAILPLDLTVKNGYLYLMIPDSSNSSDSEAPNDLELMGRVAQKDEAAFAELFKRFQNRVINLSYRYLGNRDDAELITQDIFLRIWEHARTFRGSSQVWTWIYRVAVNVCLTFKSHKRWPVGELDDTVPAEASAQPEAIHTRNEQQAVVQQALDSLSPDQRMAIVLSRYEGMSYEEIGQTMNKSKTAVATLLFRAREQLKIRLTPYVKRRKISP